MLDLAFRRSFIADLEEDVFKSGGDGSQITTGQGVSGC